MPNLTPDQVDHFHREGYYVAKDVIPKHYIHDLRSEIDQAIDAFAKEMKRMGKIDQLHADLDVDHRLIELYKQCSAALSPVKHGNHRGPAMFSLITCPELLEVTAQILGPEVIASSVYRLRSKLPHWEAGELPWHQDSAYFNPCGDDHIVLIAWVPLMNATVEAGCMEVLPRTHLNGVVHHYHAEHDGPALTVHPNEMPDTAPVAVPADIGDVVLLNSLTFHSSTENLTDAIRWAADLRYNAPEAGDYYPLEAQFLARSEDPDKIQIKDWHSFERLRKEYKPTGDITRKWLPEAEETFPASSST